MEWFEFVQSKIMSYIESVGIFGVSTKLASSVIAYLPVVVGGLFSLIIAVVIVRILMKVL